MTALLLASLLMASPVDGLKFMPKGTPLRLWVNGNFERVQYFRLGEYKLLMKMDLDLQKAQKNLEIYSDLDFKYVNLVEQKDVIIRTLEDDLKVKNERLNRVEGLWHLAEKKAIENAGGPTWPYAVAGAGVVIGLIGTTLYLSTLAQN